MHVLSSWDIMVAHVVFCKNLCLWLFIGQNKCFETIFMVEDTGETCFHCPFPSFTMILVIPTTLSQDRKLTHVKHYHWVLQRGWNNWVMPSRYGVLLTFLGLNVTRTTLWNNFSGLSIKFRNKTWRQIRYLGQNITNLQILTFDTNVTPGMTKKDIL